MTVSAPPSAVLHRAFRAVLEAMSRPGVPHAVADAATDAELARLVVEAIHDPAAPVALGPGAGARDALPASHRAVEDLAASDLVLLGADPAPEAILAARRGSEEIPEAGATVVVAGVGGSATTAVVLSGPGVDGELRCLFPLSRRVIAARSAACADLPLGVDLLVVRGLAVVGLPRSTTVRVL